MWFWRREELSVYVLQETGSYDRVNHSEVLPDLDLASPRDRVLIPDPLAAVTEFRRRLRSGEN